jgi:hypothetical protein
MNIKAATPAQAIDLLEDFPSGFWATILSSFQIPDDHFVKNRMRKKLSRIRQTGKVYIVQESDLIIACLIIDIWPDKPISNACNVVSMAIHHDHQGKGYARSLILQCLQDINPDHIVAQTRNPIFVRAWSKTLSESGYRVFYGGVELTESQLVLPEVEPGILRRIYGSYYRLRGIPESDIHKSGFAHKARSYFVSNALINLDGFPMLYKQAFQPTIEISADIDQEHQVGMGCLISFKEVS